MANYFQGKQSMLEHFKEQELPFWKIYDISNMTVGKYIHSNLQNPDFDNSLKYLETKLDELTKGNMYIIDLYRYIPKTSKEVQKFSKPNHQFSFILPTDGVEQKPTTPQPVIIPNSYNAVNGNEDRRYKQPPSEQIGLRDHIALITECERAKSDVLYLKDTIADQAKHISELEVENRALREEIESLEDEIENIQESEEEESEEEKEDASLKSTLAGLLKTHGGAIVENFLSKPIQIEESITGEENDKVVINGLGDMDINTIMQELYKLDNNIHKHLHKLLLVAQQKPNTFKILLKKLEDM